MIYAHSNNAMHMNLKPGNVLLTESMHAKICDFQLNPKVFKQSPRESTHYTSPEILEGKEASEKSDVYSFGVLLFYLSTGTLPKFSERRARSGQLFVMPEDTTEWVSNLIKRCIQLEPVKRPSFTKILEVMKRNDFMITQRVDKFSILDRNAELEELTKLKA